MSITTFSQLMAYPHTKKIALVEITLSESLAGTWTLHSGDVYKITIGAESLTLPDGSTWNYFEDVSSVKFGSSTITTTSAASSVANCIATPSSYYQDTATSTLYVNFAGNNPNTATNVLPIMMSFPLRVATEGISLSISSADKFYDPLVKSIPMISQVNQQIEGGYSSTNISFCLPFTGFLKGY